MLGFKRKLKPLTNLKKKTKSLPSIPEYFENKSVIMSHNEEEYLDNHEPHQNHHPAPLLHQPTSQPFTNSISTIDNITPSSIFNSCRIPDNIKDLQTFDGSSRNLYEFINNVEEILLMIRGTEGTPYGQTLLRAIRNKIIVESNDTLIDYLTPLNWDEMKNNLSLSYADERDEPSLLQELYNAS